LMCIFSFSGMFMNHS